MTQTILVTGASGSVGRLVVDDLLGNGFNVRGQYSRNRGTDSTVEWRAFDFLRDTDWRGLVEGCAGIIHLAGELTDVNLMERINVDATASLLHSAVDAGVGYFGHASSMVVYGSPAAKSVDEDSPVIDPRLQILPQFYESPAGLEYARTKILAERAVRACADRIAIDIYRISKSAGPERFLEALNWSAPRRMMLLYGRTHYIYEEDCARAITYLMRRGLSCSVCRCETYNICDSACGTYVELLEAASRYGVTVNRSHVPVILEKIKTILKYKLYPWRNSEGMIYLSNRKLLDTGFRLETGYVRALEMMLAARHAGRGV